MRFIRGLDKKAQTKLSEYSIKDIRFMYEAVNYSVHGARYHRHNARLVINSYEIEQMQELLSERLLDSFHILVENKLFDAVGKAKDKASL